MKLIIAMIAAILAVTSAVAEIKPPTGGSDALTIAIRNNAAPFAYRRQDKPDAEFRMEGYGGFIVDICKKALDDMDIPQEKVRVLGVDVTERFEIIDSKGADILCAPVSITPKLLEKYLFSMPVFLGGISFVTTPHQVDHNLKQNIVGVLGSTTALERLESGELQKLFGKQYATTITNYLEGRGSSHDSPVLKLDSYEEGFDMICQGNLVYMLGDIDILSYYIKNDQLNCEPFISRATISREVLAVIFSPKFITDTSRKIGELKPIEFFMKFQKTIFSLLQDRQKIESMFKQHFPGKIKSQELDAFFRGFVRFPDF